MKNFPPNKYALCLLVFPFVMAGCGGIKPAKTGVQPAVKEITREESLLIKGAPEWVNIGSRLFATTRGRMLHGVAAATPMGDLALQKAVADDRARAEVTRVLSAYLDAVSAGYIAALTPPGATVKNADKANLLPGEENVASQIRGGIQSIITGIRIIGSWREAQSNNVWSIAELDLNQVKDTVAAMDGMDSGLKRYLEAEADNIFDSLANARRRAEAGND